jgi:acyl-CoA thioesterase-1
MFYTRISSYLLFTLLLLASLLASCTDKPTIHLLDEDAIVLAFGDSLTYGTGAPVGQSYPDVLATILNRRVINAGVPGEVSSAGLKRLPALLDEHQPALVILCHGGNDFLRRGNPAMVEENLRKMIILSQAAGAEVILVGVPNFNLLLNTHPLYERLAENTGVAFEGEIIEQLLSDRSLKSDNIHPNAQGYRLLAEAISRHLN